MRLLFLADRLSTRGGADLHLLQMIASARRAGADVTLGVGRLDGDVRVPEGVVVERVRGLASAVATRSGLRGLAGRVGAADVVHLQNVMNPAAVTRAVVPGRTLATIQDHRILCPGPGRTLPDGRRCTFAMGPGPCAECLGDATYRARMLDLTAARQRALHDARLIVLSRYMAGELAEIGRRSEVLPPWVTPGPGRRRAGSTVLLAGRLVAHKQPEAAVAAWRGAGRPLPLRVAGDGPADVAAEDVATLGWLDHERLVTELRQARVLLFPARWQEPFGIVGVEALAQGTPVVVSDVGGTRDWSDHGCLRVDPGDVEAMSTAIRTLTDDPGRALELGRQGQCAVARRFARDDLEPRLWRLWEMASAGRAEP